MKVLKQQGMSIIGFVFVLALVVFAAFIAMRIAPIYLEYYSVVSAMNGVASERGAANQSLSSVRIKMLNRLYVSYSDGNVEANNIRVVRKNGVNLHVAYEVRKPLVGNLDVVATFDRMVRLAN